jgi:hypothetical protein
MAQKLADNFKNVYGANTKGITNLAGSITRTKSSLIMIQDQFSKTGEITEKEKEVFLSALKILQRLGSAANSAKSDVKRYAMEKSKLQDRLRKESMVVVKKAFPLEQIDEQVAFLAWDHKIKRYCGVHNWKSYLKDEMVFDARMHTFRPPNVIAELKSRKDDLIREVITSVASDAEMNNRSVVEIVTELEFDFNQKRLSILGKENKFIQDIKAAAVAQAIEASLKLSKDGKFR